MTISVSMARRASFNHVLFIGLVSLFNGISTVVGYLMSNPSSEKKEYEWWDYLTGVREFSPFPKSKNLKVNVIVQLESNMYTIGTRPIKEKWK